MRRREFISLSVGAVVSWPLGARAQQTRLPTIGFLGGNATAWSPWTTAFVQRLHELGWIEGHTVTIDYRWNEGKPERIAEITDEFIHLKVDVIFTNAIAAPILKQATTVIPIVFAIAPDPVRSGLVASLARPGGNLTGLTNQQPDLAGKRLALLREIVPHLHRLAIGFDADDAESVAEADAVKATAHTLGLEVVPLEIRRAEDVAPAFETLKSQIDALYLVGNALMHANHTRIATFALTRRLPTICGSREDIQPGGVLSYGQNFPALFRRAAEYVDKICAGPSLAISPSSDRPNSISSSI
jgi:putative ABC transport system substrate-binding protein